MTKKDSQKEKLLKKSIYELDQYAIRIVRVNNGWLLEWYEEIEDEKYRLIQEVYEDKEDHEFEEKESFIKALWAITEYFGKRGSKHDKKRINIELKRQKT